jgi:hypothetical protein
LIGFALGGEAGARFARELGFTASPDTLLRRLHQASQKGSTRPRIVGVDDFAFSRGQRYGTLLVDLERRCPIDLLPDREAETLSAWFKAHPGIEIVTRDRSKTYASAITEGAPVAVQVADRWHLLKNLREALEKLLKRQLQQKRRLPAKDLSAVTGRTGAEAAAKRAAFAADFTQRAEFTALYPATMANAAYVDALLSRYQLTQITAPEPTNPEGTTRVTLTRADLVNGLNANTLSRAQVLRAVVQSDQVSLNAEALNAFVAAQYYGYLRRTPDVPGFNAWVNYLTQHPGDFRTMVNGFVNSQEYRLRFGQP